MAQFDFTHNALDVALRRLLMQISLPKETQQIDRVLEAFAKRYETCEPGLFGSKGKSCHFVPSTQLTCQTTPMS
jgi:Sec7-like guanine-nucleotide exchange factor